MYELSSHYTFLTGKSWTDWKSTLLGFMSRKSQGKLLPPWLRDNEMSKGESQLIKTETLTENCPGNQCWIRKTWMVTDKCWMLHADNSESLKIPGALGTEVCNDIVGRFISGISSGSHGYQRNSLLLLVQGEEKKNRFEVGQVLCYS